MTLLAVDRVSKRFHCGSRVALDAVSLVVEAGEMVVVWGERHSGRSTLLRIAAGVEDPETGTVRFDDREVSNHRDGRLSGGISYCRREFRPYRGSTVVEQLVSGQLARKVPRSIAVANAWNALECVGAGQCAPLAVGELKIEETVRVSVARALTSDPRLIVIDEPTIGVDALKRDDILRSLRSLADKGIAILASTGEGTELLGADRIVSLDKGRLYGALRPDLAPVSDLERHRQARA
jgi:ABC-type sugar transport system ATPase subunit